MAGSISPVGASVAGLAAGALSSPAAEGRFGSNRALRFGWMANSCSVKLKRGGRGAPFGRVVAGLRKSSKNA